MTNLLLFLLFSALICDFSTVSAVFRGLESTNSLAAIESALKLAGPNGHLQVDPNFSLAAESKFLKNLNKISPGRVKRAIEENDVSFARHLRDNMMAIFKNSGKTPLSGPCLADLLNFVDAFANLLQYSTELQRCTKNGVEANAQNCNCLKNKAPNVTEHAWVVKFLDSMGKMPSGILHGNMWFLGDFEQCMNIAEKLPSGATYRGKFCLTKLGMRKSGPGQSCPLRPEWDDSCGILGTTVPLNIGICMPETCSEGDMLTVIEDLLETQQPKQNGRVSPGETENNQTQDCLCVKPTCHERDMRYDAKAIIVLIILGVILALMVAGTIYEHFVYQHQLSAHAEALARRSPPQDANLGPGNGDVGANLQNGHATVDSTTPKLGMAEQMNFFDMQPVALRIALAFSIISNGRKLFDTQKRPGQVHCLHGLRFLSLAWVILGHTYYWILPTLDNLIGVRRLAKNPMNQIILNATYCVDCFFLQSGFLLGLIWLKDATRRKGKDIANIKFWIMFYVHRYIRLTPVYGLILAVDICLYRYITDGPFWNQDGLEPNYCRRSWWTNLIYLNNFLVQDELCMSWTWYLANDFQFYFFAPILLILFFKYEIIGVITAIGGILVSGVIKGVLTVSHDLPPSSLASMLPNAIETQERYWNLIYVKPYCRCGVYIVGLLLGYLLFKTRGKKVKVHWAIVAAGWVTITVMHLALLFGLYEYSSTGVLPSKPAVFIYAMFARPLWGVGLSWIIFMCEKGYGGWVNDILSWGFWIPLSKLTYCAYLLHAFVAHGTYSSRFQSAHFDTHLRMVYYFFGHLVVSYALALVFHLAFEAPILTLERIIFGARRPEPKGGATEQKGGATPAGNGSEQPTSSLAADIAQNPTS